MVTAAIVAIIVACLTIIACVYMVCIKEVKLGKLSLKEIHTQCKHEISKINLEHTLKLQRIEKTPKPQKASRADTEIFFDILKDPTVLYGEDVNNGTSGNN